MSSEPRIQLRGVRRSYVEGTARRVVLDGLEARIEAGESVAVVGRSGSGKSTLLHLVAGLDLPEEGEVRVDGVALNRMSERQRTLFRRRHVGIVFQFFNLVPTLTALENVLLPLELNGRAERARAMDLLEEVGLADRAGAWPDRLSGGEQQRLALARAVVHRPRLLLADEPTGNLDEETGLRVLDLMARLHREAGTTLVVVTHSEEVASRAGRVLHLHEGRFP